MECKPDSSYADILRLVMKNEEHSVKLYNDLKASCKAEGMSVAHKCLGQEKEAKGYREMADYIRHLLDERISSEPL